jgi:type II secretory pathway pseudopilin PulG
MEKSAVAQRQRGMSLVGLIFVGLIVVALLALGFKLVPAMVEYIAIERAVQKIRNEGSTVRDIQTAFDRHATIDDITSISSRDLDITKEGERIVISYAYQKKIPILDNVSLVIDFSGTTKDRQRKDIP